MATTCDICSGNLVIQSGGKYAVCQKCGTAHSIHRMREKMGMINHNFDIQNDSNNLQSTLKLYMDHGDFLEAEKYVKRILEDSPSNQEMLSLYDRLQDWKYMDIRNGVLLKYGGQSSSIEIPRCVSEIGSNFANSNVKKVIIPDTIVKIRPHAFSESDIEMLNLPDTITEIGELAFAGSKIKEINLPKNLGIIERGLFAGCECLESIVIPESVTEIKNDAFYRCTNLKKIDLPKNLRIIGRHAFGWCTMLSIVIPESVTQIDKEALVYIARHDNCSDDVYRCRHVTDNSLPARRRRDGLCQYCGGKFSIWNKSCKQCGRLRDY